MSNQDLPPKPSFEPAVYRHFKGGYYAALFLTRDSENPSVFHVMYQSIETGENWTRRHEDFFGSVVKEGVHIMRFERVELPIQPSTYRKMLAVKEALNKKDGK